MTKTILIASLTAAVLIAATLVFSDQIQENFASAIGSSGLDGFSSSATVIVERFDPAGGPSVSSPISLRGETLVQRTPSPDPNDPPGTIQTEIVSMSLVSVDPISVEIRAGQQFGLPPSIGKIFPRTGSDFQVDSFFDVFFEIQVGGGREPAPPLCNSQPLRLQATIDHVPPTGHVYLTPENSEPVLIHLCDDPNQTPVGAVTHAYHLPGTNEDLKVEIKKEIIQLIKRSDTVRDNVIVQDIKLKNGQRMVIVDNAGIGKTSDVEITWRFDPKDCRIQVATLPAPAFGLMDIIDDGAIGGNPAHKDWIAAEAVLLTTQPGQTCKLDSNKGEYVSVSTVGSDA